MKSIRKYPAILEFDLLRSLIMALRALLSDFCSVMAGGTINGSSHDLSLLPLFMGSVADIGFPRTIWEWQEVHRSFSPLFGCRLQEMWFVIKDNPLEQFFALYQPLIMTS